MKFKKMKNPIIRIPSSIIIWYDRNSKNWMIQLKDQEGCQIGNAIYVYSKIEAEKEMELLKEKYL